MGSRTTTAVYQTVARVWLTLAGISLLLPPHRRAGIWLPLHLALAGAVATAISGAMQNFMLALTASPDPPAWTTWTQLGLVVTGAALIAIGMPTSTPGLMALGGAAFVASMFILVWMLRRSWRLSLNKRHPFPIAAYGVALLAALIGGTLGALMGSHSVVGETYLHFKRAHMTLNVLGFASLTVVGTLVTLLPTALRVRMPRWKGWAALMLFAGGLLLQLLGWDLGSTPVLAAGGIAYAAGAIGLVWLLVSVLRMERKWKVPLVAMHMMAAIAWFVSGSLAFAWALMHGPEGFDAFRSNFLVAFVGGWLVQILLGAWAYLLPMARPGHPDARRRSLSVFELAAPVQLALLNVGLVLMAVRAAGWVGPGVGDLGVILAFSGAALALAKAWLFPMLSLGPVDTERARAVWGGGP
jgi:nitrite reductase (NO-forming)